MIQPNNTVLKRIISVSVSKFIYLLRMVSVFIDVLVPQKGMVAESPRHNLLQIKYIAYRHVGKFYLNKNARAESQVLICVISSMGFVRFLFICILYDIFLYAYYTVSFFILYLSFINRKI